MSFIFRNCCSSSPQIDIFQKLRKECTESNWQLPPKESFAKLINIIIGDDPQYEGETAFNNLLAHLEQDQEKNNTGFLLKNLAILDFVVEQRKYLERMAHYNNGELLSGQRQSKTNKTAKSVRDLIASYYIYIKQKSKYYESQSKQLLIASTRQQFFRNSNSIGILNQINICFKVQNLILDINSHYKSGDKSSQLIQYIYSLLLRTYLFCHSIVSIALKVFVSRIMELSRYDLDYIRKFVQYFGKQYTKNFMLFCNFNQDVKSFKEIKQEDMIMDCEKMIQIIQKRIKQIDDDPGFCPQPEELNEELLMAISKRKQAEQGIIVQNDVNLSKSPEKIQLKGVGQVNGSLSQIDQNFSANKETLSKKNENSQQINKNTLQKNQSLERKNEKNQFQDQSLPVEKESRQDHLLDKIEKIPQKKENPQQLKNNPLQKFESSSKANQKPSQKQGKEQQSYESMTQNIIPQVTLVNPSPESSQQKHLPKRLEYSLTPTSSENLEFEKYFFSYQNLYSEMCEPKTQQLDTNPSEEPLMSPREIYAYYGVPFVQEEEDQSEGEEDDEEEGDQEEEQEVEVQEEKQQN